MRKSLPLLLCLLIICSCASAAKDRSLKKLPDADFSVAIPDGWWKPQYTDRYLITKDGPYLQYVLIQRRPLEKSFRYTQKKMKSSMLPQEAAGIIIDELASDRFLMNFSVIENTPAKIDGQAGFKILFSYKDKKGSQFKTLYYGFINGGAFYNLRYCAAERHYFDKDIAEFEQIKNSFKLTDRTG
ncbi:MAG: PsbP-related protein [Desulfobacterales bacterium]|nr:PsbP-related protein [Desulfobacterales bacterium]